MIAFLFSFSSSSLLPRVGPLVSSFIRWLVHALPTSSRKGPHKILAYKLGSQPSFGSRSRAPSLSLTHERPLADARRRAALRGPLRKGFPSWDPLEHGPHQGAPLSMPRTPLEGPSAASSVLPSQTAAPPFPLHAQGCSSHLETQALPARETSTGVLAAHASAHHGLSVSALRTCPLSVRLGWTRWLCVVVLRR